MAEATPAIITNSIKNSCRLCIVYPINDVVFPFSGYKALNTPANLFAAAFAKNHTAINKEANLKGANLFTNDKPIGDKHNSPQVCKKYIPVSHIILTFTEGFTSFTPNAIHKYPSASKNNPH